MSDSYGISLSWIKPEITIDSSRDSVYSIILLNFKSVFPELSDYDDWNVICIKLKIIN